MAIYNSYTGIGKSHQLNGWRPGNEIKFLSCKYGSDLFFIIVIIMFFRLRTGSAVFSSGVGSWSGSGFWTGPNCRSLRPHPWRDCCSSAPMADDCNCSVSSLWQTFRTKRTCYSTISHTEPFSRLWDSSSREFFIEFARDFRQGTYSIRVRILNSNRLPIEHFLLFWCKSRYRVNLRGSQTINIWLKHCRAE